jgi:hypothetical protein
MKKFKLFSVLFIFLFTGFLSAGEKADYKSEAAELYRKLQKTRANYIKIFKLDRIFKNRWQQLGERFQKAETFYNQGDYYTAKVRFEKILEDLKYLADNRDSIEDETGPEAAEPPPKDPCSEDARIFRAAYLAEQNRNISRAIELFHQLLDSTCLPANDLEYAGRFIREKKEYVLEELNKLRKAQGYEEKSRSITAINEILKGFKKKEPKWAGEFEKLVNIYDVTGPAPKPGIEPERKIKKEENIAPERKMEESINREPVKAEGAGSPYFLAMDVWQSAWKQDFNVPGLRSLFNYLSINRINHINLNPGLPMGPKFNAESYEKFKPIVAAFYASGVEVIDFLYAELDYPIEHFAEFLKKYPGLGIDTIVDDSEFTDFNKDRFDRNLRAVHKWGIKYAAFTTLEVKGNSGVSDVTRHWMLENVDYPILMSYFGCTLEEQKAAVGKYLQYADNLGKRRRVSIAILLGGKSVGREVSCERLLNETALQRFLWDLDAWARRNHPSYRGIVIETNLRQPIYNIHLNHR